MQGNDFFGSEKAFRAILPGKIALTCERIAEREKIPPVVALERFYESPTYRELEIESTKRWWESPAELARDYAVESQGASAASPAGAVKGEK
ncbi:MAG: hypothetical protein IKO01_06220 [Kiritimatiellae bacterium]|nr:hypothetical protein [Kiritimatiellia bacterium]MBR4252597.1 hypothetical protein [Kiritimatiellia bacterium]